LCSPARTAGPDKHLLRALKEIAGKVGIDPKRAKLHSFRRIGAPEASSRPETQAFIDKGVSKADASTQVNIKSIS